MKKVSFKIITVLALLMYAISFIPFNQVFFVTTAYAAAPPDENFDHNGWSDGKYTGNEFILDSLTFKTDINGNIDNNTLALILISQDIGVTDPNNFKEKAIINDRFNSYDNKMFQFGLTDINNKFKLISFYIFAYIDDIANSTVNIEGYSGGYSKEIPKDPKYSECVNLDTSVGNGAIKYTKTIDDESTYCGGLLEFSIPWKDIDTVVIKSASGFMDFALDSLNFEENNSQPSIANLPGDNVTYSEGDPAVQLDAGSNAVITDEDSSDFNGGYLKASITSNRAASEDVLSISNQGTGAGKIGISGSNVSYAGTVIGTFTGGTGTNDLTVNFNANTSIAAAQALIRALAYNNINGDNPSTAERGITITLYDGDGDIGTTYVETKVRVTAVNDPPVVSNGSITATEDTPQEGTFTVTDVDSSSFTFSIVAQPVKGTVTIGSNGSYTYTPNANATGSDSFKFKANDGALGSDTATISVTINPMNDLPQVSDSAKSTSDDQKISFTKTDFTGKYSDAEDDPLSKIQILSLPDVQLGKLVINNSGAVTNIAKDQEINASDLDKIEFVPIQYKAGTTSFTWKGHDGTGYSDNTATVTITISKNTYAVAIKTPVNGTVSGAGNFLPGDIVKVTAKANDGYRFDGWYEGAVKLFSLPDYTFKLEKDITLTAKFVQLEKEYLQVTAVGNGVVKLDGSTTLPSNYKELHTRGTDIQLKAEANTGNVFAYWEDVASGCIVSSDSIMNITIGTGVNLKAVFNTVPTSEDTEFTVVFKDKSGKILQSTSVAKNASAVQPKAPVLAGYNFIGWDKPFNNVVSHMMITALYERLPDTYKVTVVGGTILPAAGTTGYFKFDIPVNVSANPAPAGKKFSHWEQDGIKVSINSSFTIFMPMKDTTLTAVFVDAASEISTIPFIALSDFVMIDTVNKTMTFTATRSISSDYVLVESGIVLLKSNTPLSDELTIDTENAIRGKIRNDSTDQFYMRKSNISTGDTWYARAYLIYKDSNGNIMIVYSTNTVGEIMDEAVSTTKAFEDTKILIRDDETADMDSTSESADYMDY